MKYFLLAVVIIGADLIGVDVNPPAGGGATNFTLDARCQGAWLILTDGLQASAEDDKCGTLNMTQNGDPTYAETPPAGSAALQDAVDFDGTGDFFNIADNTAFEGDTLTVGCWVRLDSGASTRQIMSKTNTHYEVGITSAESVIGNISASDTVSDAATTVQAAWGHVALRYDGDGSTPDAVDDDVEIFFNGLEVCPSGVCDASTGPLGDENSDDLVLGGNSLGTIVMNGALMECFFMDKALSDAEMAEVFLCGFDGSATGTTRDSTYTGATCAAISTCC